MHPARDHAQVNACTSGSGRGLCLQEVDADVEALRSAQTPLLQLPLVDTLALAKASADDAEEAREATMWQRAFLQQWQVGLHNAFKMTV